jgi:hypothetical protein
MFCKEATVSPAIPLGMPNAWCSVWSRHCYVPRLNLPWNSEYVEQLFAEFGLHSPDLAIAFREQHRIMLVRR